MAEEAAPAIPSQNLGNNNNNKKSDSEKKFQSYSQVKTVEPAADAAEELEASQKSKKRRRKCPAALEKFQEIEYNSNPSCFSFSFDTKISSGGTPESTPKFGSFNLAGELGLLNSSSTTQPEDQEEEFDLLGFSKINKKEEEIKKKTDIEGLIPIVVKSTD